MTLQEAIEHCEEKAKGDSECAEDHAQLAEWLRELEERRQADVVEVVRCKDCCRRENCRTANVWAISPSDEWFCADGKRREDV